MLNPEIKEKWVNALRSGEYQQTEGYLRDEQGYCCLGVLCQLFMKEHEGYEWRSTTERDVVGYQFGEVTNGGLLPPVVAEWACGEVVEDFDVEVEGYFETYSAPLAELNDSSYDFMQIAALIEEQL